MSSETGGTMTTGDGVPAEQHAQRIVDRLGEDVEVGDVLGAHGREVVQAAHDPERNGCEGEEARDVQADGDAGDHHGEPLDVGGWNADEAARGGAVALDGMEAVEGRVQDLVDDVVAAGDEGDGDEGEDELRKEMPGAQGGVGAERDDDAGEDEEVLDGVVEADDGEMRAKPLGERDVDRLGGWDQRLGRLLRGEPWVQV